MKSETKLAKREIDALLKLQSKAVVAIALMPTAGLSLKERVAVQRLTKRIADGERAVRAYYFALQDGEHPKTFFG